jgi:DNA-binding LacI/PurR family transcriptional regulator
VARGKGETTAAYPYVDILDTNAVKELVTHLIEKGHQRIAFIGASPDLVIHSDRLNGYVQGLEEAHIAFDEDLVRQGDLSEKGGYHAARDLLNQAKPPTAIIGCNDLTALGVLRAAKEKGLYIGTELAIAGYDGIKETEYTNPPLTTIFQPTYDIARELARMLMKVIEGETLAESVITIQPQLVIRASTG